MISKNENEFRIKNPELFPVKCAHCPRRFKHKGHCDRHEKVCPNNASVETTLLKCQFYPWCQNTYKTKAGLKKHGKLCDFSSQTNARCGCALIFDTTTDEGRCALRYHWSCKNEASDCAQKGVFCKNYSTWLKRMGFQAKCRC